MTGQPLPRLMVAPNGARRGKSDHPALPITLDELVTTAVSCHAAGADGLHLHIRDAEGKHSLDVGHYREAMAAVKQAAPNMFVQVTSEAAGLFEPADQMRMIRELQPASVSLALSELMRPPTDTDTAKSFYHWAQEAGVTIHHIAYTPEQLGEILRNVDQGLIPGNDHQLQLVLGSYAGTTAWKPSDIDAYQSHLEARKDDLNLDWMVCAFGAAETDCLVEAARRGAKMRVGFENSLWNKDGALAKDNTQRVQEVLAALDASNQTLSPDDK